MAIEIVNPGLATTVQDLGRPGYYHIGIPLSGGMDRLALQAANLLVGNDPGAAVLEAVFMGPQIAFADDRMVAVAGAELPPKLDGEPRETWTSFLVKAGQTLSFDFLKKGARAYIAIGGGIDVPVVLGSRSTYALGALGGHEGRTLQAGDRLKLGARRPRQAGAHRRRRSAAGTRRLCRIARIDRALLASPHRAIRSGFFRGYVEGGAGSGSHRLSLPRRASAPIRAAHAAFRRGLRSVKHCRRMLSVRVDPGSRRHRADRSAPRRGLGRRILHAGYGDLRGYGSDRPVATAYTGAFCASGYEDRAGGAGRA